MKKKDELDKFETHSLWMGLVIGSFVTAAIALALFIIHLKTNH